eukprot:6937941-Pyramimonas_sp.AAC.1
MRPPHSLFCGPIWSSTEGTIGDVRMGPPRPVQRFVALYGGFTEGPSGDVRMRPPNPVQRFVAS